MSLSPSDAYPRPDFLRETQSWTCLNGTWDFAFDDRDQGLGETWQIKGLPQDAKRHIEVPYVFQCPASGIDEQQIHEVIWYQREIHDPRTSDQKEKQDRVLACFGAVDYECTVWVSGSYVGGHRGGHVPFDLDITDVLSTAVQSAKAAHVITLRVFDSAKDVTQPRGKQFWGPKPESIFYTPSSGIWQDVWLESVPSVRLGDSSYGTILRSDDIESGVLHASIAVLGRKAGRKYTVQMESSFEGNVVSTSSKVNLSEARRIAFNLGMRLSRRQMDNLPAEIIRKAPLGDDKAWLNGVALWSPEFPSLYDLKLRLFDDFDNLIDEVKTTTGMRQITWANGDGTLRLNGHLYFQALLLDQGYWPSSLMTPPTPTALKEDIELSKAMGFNGCRKHQKVEDPRFHFWADRLGFLVWGEMASSYEYDGEMTNRFDQEWTEAVKRDINRPCVVAWTLVNESWGYSELNHNADHRNHLRSLYYQTKYEHLRALSPNQSPQY
jgi:beta-galactosidase/beta-glucuronidase